MICDDCLHQWECWEQRGRCKEYRSKEEVRNQIEMLNQKYGSAISRRADKSGLQEASRRRLAAGDEGSRDPERVQPEAGADPEAETEETSSENSQV